MMRSRRGLAVIFSLFVATLLVSASASEVTVKGYVLDSKSDGVVRLSTGSTVQITPETQILRAGQPYVGRLLVGREVEAVLPQLVEEGEDGYKRVKFQELPFYILQALKELKTEKDKLAEETKEADAKIAQLTAMLEQQQNMTEQQTALIQMLITELQAVKARLDGLDNNGGQKVAKAAAAGSKLEARTAREGGSDEE